MSLKCGICLLLVEFSPSLLLPLQLLLILVLVRSVKVLSLEMVKLLLLILSVVEIVRCSTNGVPECTCR